VGAYSRRDVTADLPTAVDGAAVAEPAEDLAIHAAIRDPGGAFGLSRRGGRATEFRAVRLRLVRR
jgi:hypothetical protein